MFSPTPWHYENRGHCEHRHEDFGDIIGANGKQVAEYVYRKDADAIIKAVNGESAAEEPTMKGSE